MLQTQVWKSLRTWKLFERLLDALSQPYDEVPERARYAEPAPTDVTARYRTFCGT